MKDFPIIPAAGFSSLIAIAPSLLLGLLFATACLHVSKFQTLEFHPFTILETLVSLFMKRFYAWKYLFHGPSMIQAKFDKSNGKSFELFAPDMRYVFVSSSQHIKEIDSAPDTVLPLQAASKQMLQPTHTMQGFNWFDRRGTEGVGFIRALRTLLTGNLPQILPDLGVLIKTRLDEFQSKKTSANEALPTKVYPMIVQLVVLSNAISFFGQDLANNVSFMKAGLHYVEETFICAEIVKLLPNFMIPIVSAVIRRHLKSQQAVFDVLLPIAEQRCRERDQRNLGQETPHHADCIQWIMETSPRQNPWSGKRVVHELMAIWFGSVHALSTTISFAIHDLCLHPEYVEPLRKELQQGYTDFERTAYGLPLLDSFIKESARLTPVESMSTRRSALKPFTLSNGTTLDPGDWLCTPVRAIMQNPKDYPEPLAFNGFRFVDPEVLENATGEFKSLQPKPSKLVDVDNSWHVWGTGRMACPGRYYASAVMKVILSNTIMNYECKLVDKDVSRYITWRSTMLPKKETEVIFTRRQH